VILDSEVFPDLGYVSDTWVFEHIREKAAARALAQFIIVPFDRIDEIESSSDNIEPKDAVDHSAVTSPV
jgi:hypothetical protein